MIGRVVDNKGNSTFKTRCDLCGVYTGEQNYILSIRLDGAIGSHGSRYVQTLLRQVTSRAEK